LKSISFDDGLSAFQAIIENEVDLILSDNMMPGLTGIEILNKIKGKTN
jgi:CheY-like chemotaxis protein